MTNASAPIVPADGRDFGYEGMPLGAIAAAPDLARSHGGGLDSRERVYVFNRGEHPVAIFDRDGTFLKSWGEGLFARPHGITSARTMLFIAPTIWITRSENSLPTDNCC